MLKAICSSPDNLSEQNAVGSVVVCWVVVPPELRSWESEVPKLINETPNSLLLSLQPLVIAVACLEGEGEREREREREKEIKRKRERGSRVYTQL